MPRVSGRQLATMIGSVEPGSAPRYIEIAEALRLFAVDGRLVAGTRLPSERELTEALGTSRTTVSSAYDRLRELGFLESRRGSGSVLCLPAGSGGTPPGLGAAFGSWQRDDSVIDLTYTASGRATQLLPWYAQAVEALPAHLVGDGCHPLGLPELRAAVAERYTARGLPTSSDQIVVTTGGLAGISAVVHAYVGAGDRVLLENPAYPGALRAVRQVGARLVGWPVEPRVDIVELTALLRQTAPRLAVLIPDFHNPTGRYLTRAERRDVAAALRAAGVIPLVDETLVELALDPSHEAAPPFAAFAPEACTVGSVSKSHWAGLQVGWVRAPRDQVARVLAARAALDLGAPVLEQVLVAAMARGGVHALDSVREDCRRQRDCLLEALRAQLPDWQVEVPGGGQSLWCRLPTESASALAENCAARGVLIAAGSAFAVDGVGLDRFVRLPFSLEPALLLRAVTVIAEEWNALRAARPARPRVRGIVA